MQFNKKAHHIATRIFVLWTRDSFAIGGIVLLAIFRTILVEMKIRSCSSEYVVTSFYRSFDNIHSRKPRWELVRPFQSKLSVRDEYPVKLVNEALFKYRGNYMMCQDYTGKGKVEHVGFRLDPQPVQPRVTPQCCMSGKSPTGAKLYKARDRR